MARWVSIFGGCVRFLLSYCDSHMNIHRMLKSTHFTLLCLAILNLCLSVFSFHPLLFVILLFLYNLWNAHSSVCEKKQWSPHHKTNGKTCFLWVVSYYDKCHKVKKHPSIEKGLPVWIKIPKTISVRVNKTLLPRLIQVKTNSGLYKHNKNNLHQWSKETSFSLGTTRSIQPLMIPKIQFYLQPWEQLNWASQ